jgi:hypothetical protein
MHTICYFSSNSQAEWNACPGLYVLVQALVDVGWLVRFSGVTSKRKMPGEEGGVPGGPAMERVSGGQA